MAQEKVKKIRLGSTTIQWDPGHMNKLVYFLGTFIVIVFFIIGINHTVAFIEGLPEAKIKATLAFAVVLVGFLTFLE